ncbi:MAG: tRNA dihydrouridine synthase DusB [Clostridia bacterium]|nr:tRNA dihydrouridine synthase DusB [Clostridia bacterium]
MKIKNVELKSSYTLAPMAGFSDCGFRSLCSEFGCGLTTTEMVSARGLLYDGEGSFSLLNYEKNESPRAVQIFSNEPEVVAEIIKQGKLKNFDIIDINMGCPMPKIVKEGMGSALLLDPKLAEKIIKSACNNTSQPVTVKFRIGYDKNNIIATDFAKMCEDSGASAITVHGRTKTQAYEGRANWDVIGDVSSAVKIPVIGNGDVLSLDEAEQKIKTYGCCGIAIGRGALGRPWIFSNKKTDEVDVLKVIKKHFAILEKYYSERLVLLHMRKHLACYIKDVKKAKIIRHKIVTSQDKQEIFNLICEVFKK